MPYGIIKVDTITFTDGGADKTVSISGLVQNPTFSGNITVTGTVSGNVIQGGTTVSGATVTGTAGQFGTLTGNTAGFTTITGATVTGTVAQFTTITGGTAGFTTVTGATVTGTTANFTTLSGTTVTGNTGSFTTVTGGVATITSGVFAVGAEALPSISFASDPNTGIYSPGADQVAISTGGSGRLFVASDGKIGIGSSGSGTQSARTFIEGSGACPLEIDATAGSGGYLTLSNSGSAKAFFGFGSNIGTASVNDIAIRSQSGALAFQTGGANERLRITSTGALNFVGAGTAGSTQAVSFNGSAPVNSLVIDSSGRLGVGTSSPDTNLHVVGTSGSGSIQIGNGASDTQYHYVNFGGSSSSHNAWQIGRSPSGGVGPANGFYIYDLKNSTARLVVDSSGRVGIGTTSPTSLLYLIHAGSTAYSQNTEGLTLRGSSALSTSFTSINFDGAGYAGNIANVAGVTTTSGTSYANSAGALRFATKNTTDATPVDRLSITAAGNVGIGTTPDSRLHVSDASGNALRIGYTSGGNFNIYDANIHIFRSSNATTDYGRFDASGRLLVGTSSSISNVYVGGSAYQSPFQVIGNAPGYGNGLTQLNYSAGGYASTITLGTSKNATVGVNGAVSSGDDIGIINFTGNDGTNFRTGAYIIASIDGTTGTGDLPTRLAFWTAADGSASPTEKMRISQNGLVTISGPGGGTFLNLSNSGGYSGLHEVDNTAYTIGQNSDVRAMRIGSGANWLTTGVNLAPGGTSWGTYSDERLKTDIVELTDCLDDIKGIRCISYRLTDVDDANSKKRIGVIAQDLVGKYDEAINTSRRSENDETEYLSVQYSDLIPVLLKALQEASVKIETLEAKVAALEAS